MFVVIVAEFYVLLTFSFTLTEYLQCLGSYICIYMFVLVCSSFQIVPNASVDKVVI